MSTMPTRVDRDLFESARAAGEITSRSATQQLAHWARIGREVELGSGISQAAVAAALGGGRAYDALGPEEQALVRAEWAERIEAARRSLDLRSAFAADGHEFVGLDEAGRPVRYAADGSVVEVLDPAAAVADALGQGTPSVERGAS